MSPPGTILEWIQGQRRQEVVELARSVTREADLAAAVTLLADVQREVGRRWQRQEFSVADEHAVTAVIDLALAAACLEAAPGYPAATRGTVVVACAEEEWHVLPARMFAEQLRAAGWDVVFLGASTPADHLRRFLAARPPAAVGLSCTVPLYLPGARRTAAASHAAGVPVVAGGAAFGATARRAAAIGADAWAATPASAAAILAGWAGGRPALAEPAVDEAPALALGAERPALVEHAMTELAARCPRVARYTPWQLAKTREDLNYMIRFVEAAMLTGDDSVVTDFARWLAAVLSARGLPDGVVAAGAGVLRDGLGPGFAEAGRLLAAMAASGPAPRP